MTLKRRTEFKRLVTAGAQSNQVEDVFIYLMDLFMFGGAKLAPPCPHFPSYWDCFIEIASKECFDSKVNFIGSRGRHCFLYTLQFFSLIFQHEVIWSPGEGVLGVLKGNSYLL